MNRECESTVELGVVSADTKGVAPGIVDQEFGEQLKSGLSDD
jgi:hypothetical protein